MPLGDSPPDSALASPSTGWWKELVEALPQPVHISIGGVIRYVNPAGVDLYGGDTADDIIGRSLSEFLPSFDPDALQRRAAQVYDERIPTSPREHQLRRLNGEILIVESRSVPIEYDGKPAAQTIVRDVTLQRRREDKVRGLYDAMSGLLRLQSRKAVADRILSLINEIFSYPLCTVRFLDDEWLVPMAVSPETIAVIGKDRTPYALDGGTLVARAFQRGASVVYDDLEDALDDGVDRGRVRSAAYIPIGADGIVSIGSTQTGGIDVFDVQLVEILTRNAETVLDRLRHEEALRSARDEAQEDSRLKSAMIANMSHEIRTPLTSIVGFAEVIEEEADTDLLHRFAGLIRKEGVRLQSTLESVLQLSRLDAGKQSIESEPVDLAREAIAVSLEQADAARRADVELRVGVDGYDYVHHVGLWCETDPTVVQRIVRNLVSNAIKYTEPGGRVDVQVATGPRGAWLEVEDTGVGMSPAFQKQMFEPYSQESAGLRREHGGIGLGLAIVSRLVDLLNGHIEVESTPGSGTRMTVLLPKVRGDS